MRHTAITRMVKSGADVATIQKISGHKTLAMVLRYTHIDGAHIDQATEALSIGFSGAITPELHTTRRPMEAVK
jgi:integrase